MSEEKKKYGLPDTVDYDTSAWEDTKAGANALLGYVNAKDALASHPNFSFSQNDWLNSVMNGIKNYGNFSYDFNADALYQQYKDKYIQQGRMAMADTIGQASAMTGGYGNSYATTAGSQAYQAHLQNLNDVIPELYQLALDRYNMGKEDLYNQYSLLSNEYNREYGEHNDEYNRLKDSLAIAQSDYYDGGTNYYNYQTNQNSTKAQEFSDAMALYEAAENARRYEESKKVVVEEEDDEPIKEPTKEPSKSWDDHDEDTLKANQKEIGGSYYRSATEDVDSLIKEGKSYQELMTYAQEMVGNSYLTKSEYMTLVQYIRKKMYG